MASYKIIKQVDGLENVIKTARHEAKRYYSKRLPDILKEIHSQRLEAICETLEKLGIVDDEESLFDDLLQEAWEESKKCNS